MRSSARTAAILGALLAVPVSAHLLPATPDLDAWLRSGHSVVVLRGLGEPESCGPTAYPALQRVEIEEVLVGEMRPGVTEVLVADDHRPAPRVEEVGLVVLTDAGGELHCPRLPAAALAGPWEQPVRTTSPAAWRSYASSLRRLAGAEPGTREGQLRLWAAALRSGELRLGEHAASRLAAYRPLPPEVQRDLADAARDPATDARLRAMALSLAGTALDGGALAVLSGDEELPVAEAAVERLLDGDEETRAAAVEALAAVLESSVGSRPVDRIRRVSVAAVMAAAGDSRGRSVLEAGLESRLFKVRVYSVRGLGYWAARGDGHAVDRLRERRASEPDRRVLEVVDAALEGVPEASPTPSAAPSPRVGLRMVLVLLGLLALGVMLLLPVLTRGRGSPRN